MIPSEIISSSNLESDLRLESVHLTNFLSAIELSPDYSVEDYLAETPVESVADLVGMIAIEMRTRFSKGEPSTVEEYVSRFPQVLSDQEQFLDLIYAEFCAKKANTENIEFDETEYYERFPEHKEELERQFAVHEFQLPGPPQVGDTVIDFELVRKLGHGSFGSVFLARQHSLANRYVVVKITPMMSDEHEVLGTLNHPCIVPILSVHQEELHDRQTVCLPYQHAIALNTLQEHWEATESYPSTLRDITHDVCKVLDTDAPEEQLESDPSIPLNYDYARACCWIMSQLADALAHSHSKGIYHCDIKPSNILITAKGRPLLVDFNLAFQSEHQDDTEWKAGGTIPYMPPEQVKAALARDRSQLEATAQYDIYSLGVTIYELLTNRYLFARDDDQKSKRTILLSAHLERRMQPIISPRQLRVGVPGDFERIILKCLKTAPEDRYRDASHITEDLECSLRDKPLSHTGPNPIPERLHKLVKRSRKVLLAASLIAFGLVFVAVTVTLIQREMARNDFEIALGKIDGSFKPLYDRGYDEYQNGQLPNAISAFNLALRYKPNNENDEENEKDLARAYFYRGKCKALLQQDDEALRDYDQSIEIRPDPYSHKERGIFYATSETLQDLKEAESDLDISSQLISRKQMEETFLQLDIGLGYWCVGMQVNGDERVLLFDKCASALRLAKTHANATTANIRGIRNSPEFSEEAFRNSEPVQRVFGPSGE